MTRSVLRRLAPIPVVVWAVATITFIVLRVVPGSAVDQLVGQNGSVEQRARARAALGLDHSTLYQYWVYLKGVVHFDFGVSYYSGRSVSSILVDTMPVTIELAVAAGLLMIVFGVLTGVLAAALRDTWVDTAIRGLAAVLFSMPWFFAGVLLLLLFTSLIPILPGFGRLDPSTVYHPRTHFVLIDAVIEGQPGLIGPWVKHLILPALATGLTSAGFITRIARSSVIETLGQDHVRTARAKGVSPWGLYRHHVLRNAALPVTTIIGLQAGTLLGGAVVSEIVFSYPGVGKLLVDTIGRRDYPVVEGAALIIALCYVLANVLTDASYAVLDPRLRR